MGSGIMNSKMNINIEFGNIDELFSKLHSELQRYDALRKFIEYSIRFMDKDSLKEIEKKVQERKKEFERWLSSWDESSVEEYWRKLSSDEKMILESIKKHGKITKSELMKITRFEPMEIAGKIAGMNNRAKKMGKKPVILREDIRLEGKWDVEYKIEESFLKYMK
jgi:hypothetical protein